jgi:ABC-type transport system involved in multi-copper enzyme maturation permease subunit
MRIELGPVFRLRARRLVSRKAWYLLRVLLAVNLAALFISGQVAYSSMVRFAYSHSAAFSYVAGGVSSNYGVLSLFMAFAIAPLAAVGSFTGSRGKYMLTHLLSTPLSGREIVWQSFAAGLVPGVTMWLCSLPFVSFLVGWWGLDPAYVGIVAAVTLSSMCASVASALAFSLWSGGLFSTIVGVYALWFGWLLGTGQQFRPGVYPGWEAIANPFVLLAPVSRRISPSAAVNAACFAAGAAVFTIVILEIAAATFRRSVLGRQNSARGRLALKLAALSHALSRRPAGFRAPSLDDNPILWREWRRARGALGMQAFWILYVLGCAITTAIGARAYWVGPRVRPILAGDAGYELGIGVLALAVQASLVWSEEKSAGREGTDVLLTTPLSAATIVNEKWRGVYRSIMAVLAFPVISTLIILGGAPGSLAQTPEALAALSVLPLVAAQSLLYGAAFVSVGIILATRFAKPSHAVLCTIGLYLGVALIVPTLAEIAFLGTNRALAAGLAMASPIAAPIMIIMTRFPDQYFGTAEYAFPYAAFWLVVAAGVTWTLYRWTIRQFDHWMGRIPAAGRKSGSEADPAWVALE